MIKSWRDRARWDPEQTEGLTWSRRWDVPPIVREEKRASRAGNKSVDGGRRVRTSDGFYALRESGGQPTC